MIQGSWPPPDPHTYACIAWILIPWDYCVETRSNRGYMAERCLTWLCEFTYARVCVVVSNVRNIADAERLRAHKVDSKLSGIINNICEIGIVFFLNRKYLKLSTHRYLNPRPVNLHGSGNERIEPYCGLKYCFVLNRRVLWEKLYFPWKARTEPFLFLPPTKFPVPIFSAFYFFRAHVAAPDWTAACTRRYCNLLFQLLPVKAEVTFSAGV